MASIPNFVAKGHKSIFAFRRNTNSWGGKAAVCGAGHGFELDNHSLLPNVEMIENDAATGAISRRSGVKGNEIVAGDIGPLPVYYRGIEPFLAQVLGTAGTPSNLGGAAYKHQLRLAAAHDGVYGTFLADHFGEQDGPIWEYPHAKLTGFRLECEQGQMAKLTLMSQAFGINYNIGTPDPVTIVASVQPANGARTIANQPGKARKAHVRITDADTSITEYVLTFVGEDDEGQAITETYTKSVHGLLWTSTKRFRRYTSITGSALAGTATGDTLEIFTAPIVRRVTPANGALTIDAQPDEPTQLLITITDANSGITEYVVDFVGVDRDGRGITAQYVLSRDGGPGSHTFITREFFASVTSATGSALAGTATAGTDFIQIDCANGVNNRSSIGNVTLPADRDLVIFGDIESVLMNDQAGGNFTPAAEVSGVLVQNDEIFVNRIRVELNLSPTTGDVTTRHRNRIDEPVTAGAAFAETTVAFNISKYDRRSHQLLKAQLSKAQKKMKITFKGPQIGATGFFFQFEIWLNAVQLAQGTPAMSGPGVLPFDITATAHQVSAVPTGFPSGLDEPIGIDIQSTLSTDPLAA